MYLCNLEEQRQILATLGQDDFQNKNAKVLVKRETSIGVIPEVSESSPGFTVAGESPEEESGNDQQSLDV